MWRGWSSGSRTRGVAAPLLLMQSNGGVAGAAAIRRAPALTALSGPAAGVVGAREVAAACGHRATSSPSISAAPAPTSA